MPTQPMLILARFSAGLIGALLLLLLAPAGHAQPVAPGQPQQAPGQEAEAAAPAGMIGEGEWRIHFVIQDQVAYKEHPFHQMTGDGDFSKGRAGTGNSWQFDRATGGDEDDLLNSVLGFLPSFGIEYARSIDFPFPRGVSFGLDHVQISQTDREAIDQTTGSVTLSGRASMDTTYDFGVVRFFAFDPGEEGINYFVGVGLGIVNGVLDAKPAGGSQEVITLSQAPVGLTRFGIEANGENFGFRYEISLVNADEVKMSKNPYTGLGSVKTIDFTSTLIRIAIQYRL